MVWIGCSRNDHQKDFREYHPSICIINRVPLDSVINLCKNDTCISSTTSNLTKGGQVNEVLTEMFNKQWKHPFQPDYEPPEITECPWDIPSFIEKRWCRTIRDRQVNDFDAHKDILYRNDEDTNKPYRKVMFMNPDRVKSFLPLVQAVKNVLLYSRHWENLKIGEFNERLLYAPFNNTADDEWLRFCQVGVGDASWLFLEIMLDTFSNAEFYIFDTDRVDPKIWTEMGDRNKIFIEREIRDVKCDVIVYSADSRLFSFHRYQPLFKKRKEIILVHNRYGCPDANFKLGDDHLPEPPYDAYCLLLESMWAATVCGHHMDNSSWINPPCTEIGCACMLPTPLILNDPFFEPMNCTQFFNPIPIGGERRVMKRNSETWGSSNDLFYGLGQFNQDWFIYHNFFKHYKKPGLYVELGAMDPYVLSNSAVLDHCVKWNGIVIEPNPSMAMRQRIYRTARVVENCIGPEGMNIFVMDKDTSRAMIYGPAGTDISRFHDEQTFYAYCYEDFGAMVLDLNVKRIDYLSVDIEGWEIKALWTFPFDKIDVRVISVENSHEASLPVDTALIPWGFMKVALLGKDHIYVNRLHLKELSNPFGPWQEVPIMDHGGYQEDPFTFQRRYVDPSFGET